MTLTVSHRNEVQPWDHYLVRDEYGHLLTAGKPVGSRVRHPRMRGCADGLTFGNAWSYALACPIA